MYHWLHLIPILKKLNIKYAYYTSMTGGKTMSLRVQWLLKNWKIAYLFIALRWTAVG